MKNKKQSAEKKGSKVYKSSTPHSQHKPDMKWQVGEYARHAEFRFMIPYQFLLLCKLLNITPEQMLVDFMDNASLSSWNREGKESARASLKEYLLLCRYGQEHYFEADIQTILKELEAIGLLWPDGAKMSFIDLHAEWRDKYYKYWFKKWFRKPRRKI